MTDAVKTATELLDDSERATHLRDRHRDYYVALAEQAEVELRGPDQASWREMCETEFDNLRLALEWSLTNRDSEAALRLATAIYSVWYRRGDELVAREWLEKSLALDEETPTPLRSKALTRLARVVWQVSHTDAFALLERALEIARESGDQNAVHEVLVEIGEGHRNYASRQGGWGAIRALQQESLEIARQLGNDLAIADSLSVLSHSAVRLEGHEASTKLADEAIRLYRKLGDLENIAWMIYSKGWSEDTAVGRPLAEEALTLARELKDDTLILCVIELIGWQRRFSGDYSGARKVFEDAVEEYRRPGRKWPIPWGVSWMLTELAEVELDAGNFESGESHAEEAIQIMQEHEYKAELVWPLDLQAAFAAARGEYANARSKCEQAGAFAREVGRPLPIVQSLHALAAVARWEGDYPAARAAAEEALSVVAVTQQMERQVLEQLGLIALAEGDLHEARSVFQKVLDSIHERPWWAYEEPMIQLRLGQVALTAGELETASALFGAALSKVQEMGHKPFAAWALEELGALAAVKSEFERAAKLFGASESIREEARAAVAMDQRRFYEETFAAIRDGLDEDALQKALTEGRSMSLDDAVLLALEGPNGS